MKHSGTILGALVLLFSSQILHSQGFSAEIYSGTNFSDIHGQSFGGKWKSKPGPSQGFNLKYSMSKNVGLQTGMNFSRVYYEHLNQFSYNPWPFYYPLPYMDMIAPYLVPVESMDLSMIRIPLMLSVSVPSTPRFNMSAGMYYGFLTDNKISPDNYYYREEPKVEKHDYGYIFSSGISYPVGEKFSASLNASYITGRKHFLENYPYKHGSYEFTLGIEYTGFLKKRQAQEGSDTSKHVIVTLLGGIDYSWNGGIEPNGEYNGITGPYLGFSLKFPLGHKTFFQTGFAFERKGFSLKDSTDVLYRIVNGARPTYFADTKVQVDYAVIPIQLTFYLGKNDHVFISTGPWLGLKLNARNVGTAYNDQRSVSSYQLRKSKVYDDIEEYVTKTDAGWLFAIGANASVLKTEFEISLQYNTGFKDVFTGTNDLMSYDDPGLVLKNRTVSLIFGIRLPYSK